MTWRRLTAPDPIARLEKARHNRHMRELGVQATARAAADADAEWAAAAATEAADGWAAEQQWERDEHSATPHPPDFPPPGSPPPCLYMGKTYVILG